MNSWISTTQELNDYLTKIKTWKENLNQKSKISSWKVNEVQTKTIESLEQILKYFKIEEVQKLDEATLQAMGKDERKEYHKKRKKEVYVQKRQEKVLENMQEFKKWWVSTYRYMKISAKQWRVLLFKQNIIKEFSDFGFTQAQILRYIRKYPLVFIKWSASIKKNLDDLYDIAKIVNLDKDSLIEQILFYPILATSKGETLKSNYDNIVKFFFEELNLSEDYTNYILSKYILLLTFSENNFKSKIDFFLKKWFTINQVSALIIGASSFFNRGLPKLRNIYKIFSDYWYSLSQVKEIALLFPSIFWASLDKLKSFFKIIKERDLLWEFATYPVLFAFYNITSNLDSFNNILQKIKNWDDKIFDWLEDQSRLYKIKWKNE